MQMGRQSQAILEVEVTCWVWGPRAAGAWVLVASLVPPYLRCLLTTSEPRCFGGGQRGLCWPNQYCLKETRNGPKTMVQAWEWPSPPCVGGQLPHASGEHGEPQRMPTTLTWGPVALGRAYMPPTS